MNKSFLLILVIVLFVAGLLFYDQVLAIFQGMTPLEAMRQITTFVLHVIVVTILSYLAFQIPEVVKPWMRMLRKRHRAKGHSVDAQKLASRPYYPRGNKDQMLYWMLTQLARRGQPPQQTGRSPSHENEIHIDL